MKKSGLVFLMILAALVLAWGTRAEAQTFLGEICWNITITEKDTGPIPPETIPARMGVTYMGGVYYTLQGIFSLPEGPAVLEGTGIVQGSQVLITFNMTHDEIPFVTRRLTSTFHMVLSASNLSGTTWDVGIAFNTATRTFAPHYSAGTATFTSCP
jgi:hypothetical protein